MAPIPALVRELCMGVDILAVRFEGDSNMSGALVLPERYMWELEFNIKWKYTALLRCI